MPDFSPLPSAANNALLNLKFIAEDTTIYIAPGWLGSAGKTGSAGTWTGQTLGNDTTGDGTVGKPFATLKRAWEEAQKYTITGKNTLYVQFQKGIYDLNGGTTHDNFFPDNLYHPQGGNIIIQGDPAAVKQKYLWQVANYTWDLAKFSHWGHTGNIKLWNLSGGTAHGFTGEDEGGYVAISNVSMGSAEYYEDPSQVSGATLFRDVRYDTREEIYSNDSGYQTSWGNWGNHFFSHLYPYEDSDGILGLAKISGASGSGETLGVVFKNQNTDSRVIGFYEDTPSTHAGRIAPGLSNSGPWAGISASWPESQYSKPNGYYGLTAARNINYPARPAGVTHISDEIFTVTNYPVVIRSTISSTAQKTPIVIRGGKIKAIRNLFFTTSAVDGVSSGAQSLSYSLKEVTPDIKTHAPSCVHLDEMSELGIRHIGICGYETGIRINNSSKVKAYSSIGVESLGTDVTNQHLKGSPVFKADSQNNPLDNTPVAMMHLVTTGVLCAQDSLFDTSLGHSYSSVYRTDSSVWLQTIGNGIRSLSSKNILGTVWTSLVSSLPCFRLTLNIPVFGGSTVGASAGFYNPEAWNYNTFKDVRILFNTTATSYDYLGRIYGVAAGTTFQTDATENSGWTGSVWSKSAGYAEAQPLYTQRVHFYGYWLQGVYDNRFHGYGGRYVDFRRTVVNNGLTFEIRAYSDQPGTAYVSGLCFGTNTLSLRAQNGSYISGTTTGRGFTASVHRYTFLNQVDSRDGAFRTGGFYMYGGCLAESVFLSENSSLLVTKMLNIRGGGGAGLNVSNSKVSVRTNLSTILVSEHGHSAIRFESGSEGCLGNIFCKNPHPGHCIGGRSDVLTVRGGSRVWHGGNLAAIVWPLTNIGVIPLFDTSDANARHFGYSDGTDVDLTNVYASQYVNQRGCPIIRGEFGTPTFQGWWWGAASGLGHRVSATDGAKGGAIENSGAFSGYADPVVIANGNSVISTFVKTGTMTPASTFAGMYSFSKIIFTAAAPSAGFPISSRKAFGNNQYPTRCSGGTRYQWWLQNRYGHVDSYPSTGIPSSTGLWKVPIMLTSTGAVSTSTGAAPNATNSDTTFTSATSSYIQSMNVPPMIEKRSTASVVPGVNE
jgi:hypothetical protein